MYNEDYERDGGVEYNVAMSDLYFSNAYGPFAEAGIGTENVEEILRYRAVSTEGYGEEEVWIVARLKDGLWVHINGGCDTTGWDCRAGASAWFASSEDELVRDHLTNQARKMLGYPELVI